MSVITVPRLLQESSREYVYRFLKTNIMNFSFPPGSALSEKDIAAMLDVSRTPVREAFIQLSQEDLLEIVPQKGTYVSHIDLDGVEESKFLREKLEVAIVELACQEFPGDKLFDLQSYIALQELCLEEKNYAKFYEIDDDIHRTIFEGCKKARIWAMMQQLHAHYNRVRLLNIASGHDVATVLEQHKNLVRAIREQDVALGRKTIQLHLNKVRLDIKDLIHDYSDYFRQSGDVLSKWTL